MTTPPHDPRRTLREDLLAGEGAALERVRAHLAAQAQTNTAGATNLPPERTEAAEDAALAGELAWVQRVERDLRAAHPDADLARRVCAALPIGRPRQLTPLQRAFRSPAVRLCAAAAAVILMGGLVWTFYALPARESVNDAGEALAGALAPRAALPVGLVEYRAAEDFDPHRRRVLDGERHEIETKPNERASVALDPWLADAVSKEPAIYRTSTANASQTAIEIDTASKVVTQLYEARPAAESWMLAAYELARAHFANAAVTGPILEVQVVRGSARLSHNGIELELHDADMVLLARQGPPLRVDAATPAPGEAPANLAPAMTPLPHSPDRGWIEGIVSDHQGRSLERFDITIWHLRESADQREQLARETVFFFSSPDGRFVVEGLEPGRYRIGVASPEHVTTVSQDFEVPKGGTPHPLELALDAGAPLCGRVLRSKDGSPIANARVRIANPARPWWWTASDTYGEVLTEPDGSFRCLNRAAGYDALWIEADGYASRWVPPVPLGSEGSSVPLELRLEDESVLHGTVSDAEGEARRGVEIAIHGLASCVRQRTRTDDRGYFRIGGLGRGNYQIAVLDADGEARSARLVELGTAHVLREDFGGVRAHMLRGVLRDAQGQALGKHKLLLYERSGDGALRFAPQAEVKCGADGSFELELPPTAQYRVRVEAADETWSSDLGEFDSATAPTSTHVAWDLRGNEVHGSVRLSDSEVANALRRGGRVVLRASDDPGREWRSSLSDGHFHFHAVPPGNYRLYARVRGLYIAPREIGIDATATPLVLDAQRAARVEVSARDTAGKVVLDLAAWQQRSDGERRLRTRATPSGLLIEELPAEAIDIVLRSQGFETVLLHFDLARESAPRVEVELQPR